MSTGKTSDQASDYSEVTRLTQSIEGSNKRPQLSTSVLPTIIDCIDQIGKALHNAHHVSLAGTSNAFGDEQLNVDVLAENILRSAATRTPSLVTLSSEEDPVEKKVEHTIKGSNVNESYTLAFDPLDGSSIIAPNWTVGTIIGIWEGSSALQQSPAKQIAAVLGIYGPRTTAIVALRPPGTEGICFEIGLKDDNGISSCEVLREQVTMSALPVKTRYFAPANLRAAADDKTYLALVNHYITEKYTLRYSGGLVPDVLHMLVKGHGIYISPVTAASKAKLRNLFELAPIALVMECAGAKAINPATGTDILESVIGDCDERGGLICGTAEEVDLVKKFLKL